MYHNNVTTSLPQARNQGISAIVWDNILQAMSDGKIPPEHQPTKAQKIQWVLDSELIEKRYEQQKTVIVKLAKFFAKYDIKMMLLKGYGLSLNYPN